MPKRVAILQSNYIPWKGYFDIINDVDDFVFLDDVQYTRQDWRNRNRIKTRDGVAWLTIPVGTGIGRRICDVPLPRNDWARRHWTRIRDAYRDAPYFQEYGPPIEELYLDHRCSSLSELNQRFVRTIAHVLGITTRFHDSRNVRPVDGEDASHRLLSILRAHQAAVYVSGPSARTYLDAALLTGSGVTVEWKSYEGYPEYPQLHPPFAHDVTVLDLLFNTGPRASHHIWGWRAA